MSNCWITSGEILLLCVWVGWIDTCWKGVWCVLFIGGIIFCDCWIIFWLGCVNVLFTKVGQFLLVYPGYPQE